ncbi:MAG: AsmA family protein [Saprospiraceae bacterium]|nr:AsmA family protein [Saprospiraceae bacterium]
MFNLFKKIVVWVGGAFLLVIGTAVVITFFFEDEIGDKLVKAVNQQLKTSLKVEDFNLSIFGGFPDVSAELINVVVEDTEGAPLLEAEKVAFRLQFFSLFKNNIEVKKVIAQNGALQIHIDKSGKANYDIIKPAANPDKSNNDLALDIAEAQFQDIELIYKSEATANEVYLVMENAVFSGNFSAQQFDLESMAKLRSSFIEQKGTRFLVGKEIGYMAKVFVNLETGYYDFAKLDVAIEKNVFQIDGFIDQGKDGTDYDLVVNCSKGNLQSVLQLLPEQYLEPVKDFEGSGNFLFSATVKGRQTRWANPAISARVTMENARITSPRLKDDLKDVVLEASFTNGSKRSNKSSIFEISKLKGYFNRELLEGKLRVANLDDPDVLLQLDGAIPMQSIFPLFNNASITDAGGEIEIKKFKLEGKYSDMVNPSRIYLVKASGKLEFDDASLEVHNEELVFDKGTLQIENNKLSLKELRFEGAGSDMLFTGEVENLLPVIFADSLNSKNALLTFKSSLVAEEMDLDRLVGLTKVSEEKKEAAGSTVAVDSLQKDRTQKQSRITSFLKGTFEAKVKDFNYDKIVGEDFVGSFTIENNELVVKGEAKGMEGYFDLDGTMFFTEEPYLVAKIEANEINIKDFFQQSQNFNQDYITDENLDGSLTARILIDAFWNEKAEYQGDKLHVLAGLSIENGELKNLKLLESFSSYIHMEDLKHIKFEDLENWLEIKNNTVHLPVMFISSNALNMTASGKHTFDQEIDYFLKINAGQVLVNRIKPHNPSLDPQSTQKKGWFNLYYTIDGTTSDFEVKTSRKKVMDAFVQSDIQKKRIQSELVKAFGPIEFDTEPQAWQDVGGSTPFTPLREAFKPVETNTKMFDKPKESPKKKNKVEEDEFIDWDN